MNSLAEQVVGTLRAAAHAYAACRQAEAEAATKDVAEQIH